MFGTSKVWLATLVLAVCAASNPAAAPAPATASGSPLAVIPAQAPVFVHVKGIDRVRGRLKAMVTAAAPDFGDVAAGFLDQQFGNLFEGRDLSTMPANGPFFLVLPEMPHPSNGEVNQAFIARVNTYADFRNKFLKDEERKSIKPVSDGIEKCEIAGAETFIVNRKDHVVLTPKKELAEMFAKDYSGIDGKIAKELAEKLLEGDVGVYVDMMAVNKEFGDQIRQGREMFMTLLDQGFGGMEKNQTEMIKKLYSAMFGGVTDSRAMILTADFRPEGFALHAQSQVGPETNSAEFLKKQSPVPLANLGKLPGKEMVYAAYDMSPDGMKAIMSMAQGMMAAEDGGNKAMEAALDQLMAAKGKASYASSNYPVAGITFQEFDDAAKAVSAMLAIYKAMGEGSGYMGGMLKGKPVIKADAQEHRGVKFASAKIAFDFDKMGEMIPGGGDAMKVYFKKMMGEELNVWFGASGSRMITVIAKDWSAAKEKVDLLLDGKAPLESMPAFQATRKQLPAQASMIYLVDAGPYTFLMLDSMVTMFKAMPVLPFQLPDSIKPVATKPAFIGMAVTLQPERGSFDFFLPAQAAREINKVVRQLFQGN